MKKACLFAGLAIAAANEGGPGTQTILLIKGGVGFDVNLLSSGQTLHHRLHNATKTVDQLEDIQGEQKAAEKLSSELNTTRSTSDNVGNEVKELEDRVSMSEKELVEKQQEVVVMKKSEVVAEKKAKKAVKAVEVKQKMLVQERRRADMLEKKVQDLERDIVVSNRAWKEAADHEKKVAEQETQVAHDAASRESRLSSRSAAPAHSHSAKSAPKAARKLRAVHRSAPTSRPLSRTAPHMTAHPSSQGKAARAPQEHVKFLRAKKAEPVDVVFDNSPPDENQNPNLSQPVPSDDGEEFPEDDELPMPEVMSEAKDTDVEGSDIEVADTVQEPQAPEAPEKIVTPPNSPPERWGQGSIGMAPTDVEQVSDDQQDVIGEASNDGKDVGLSAEENEASDDGDDAGLSAEDSSEPMEELNPADARGQVWDKVKESLGMGSDTEDAEVVAEDTTDEQDLEPTKLEDLPAEAVPEE